VLAEAKREAVVFQLKTLDLLDIFARKEGGSALSVRLVAPLFTLVQEADKSGAQVSSRAAHILRSSLAKNKVHAAAVPVADVLPTLRELHAVARRNAAPELQSLASTANAYLTRTVFARGEEALPKEGAEELLALYRETLGDFLSRKSCALRPAFLLDVLKRCPTIGWELRGELVAAARPEAATNAFRLSQTLAMLQPVLTHATSAAPRDAKLARELAAFLPDVSGFVLATLTAAAAPDAPAGLRAERLKELLRFALAAVRLTRRADAALVERVWKPAKLAAAREALAASERFASSTGMLATLRQLEAVAGAPAASEGKRGAAGAAERDTPGKKRKAQ
jgi:DNA polymerase phi